MLTREIPIDICKAQKVFDEMKDRLTQQEQDLVNALFEISNKTPKSKEEFKEMYKLDYEGMRSVLCDVLTKCKKEMNEIQDATHLRITDNIWIKTGDVVEIEMDVSEEPLETKDGPMIWHDITYKLNDRELHSFSFDLPEDQKYEDIYEYIDNCVCDDLEIEDYHSFDATDDGFSFSAKIKVLKIKEEN